MLDLILDYLISEVRRHPFLTVALVLGFVRLWGVVIQTGWTGVLFVWGRARQTLDPGFHWLLPLIHNVRKTPIRSITLELPKQRVTTFDGLVYDVDANLVYRIDDAIRALTQIDDLKKGCTTVLTLAVQQVLSRHTRESLQERSSLDEELAAEGQDKLKPWGVLVEQAGFTTIAPTRKTLRLIQLSQLIAERRRILHGYHAAGLSPEAALTLLGAHRHLTGHARARYRKLHRKPGMRRGPIVQTVAGIFQWEGDPTFTVTHDETGGTTTETASAQRSLVLRVGDQTRCRMSSRRRIDKIMTEKRSTVHVQPLRDDPSEVELIAVREGETILVLANKQSGAETVRISVSSG